MSLFKNIFKSDNSENKTNPFNWIPLTDIEQLEEAIKLSKNKTVVIFKHSTRCGISSGVLSKFEKTTDSTNETIVFYYLDLLNFRSISNEIAQKFNIHHQSPQAIVLKDKKVVAYESHYDIISSLNLM